MANMPKAATTQADSAASAAQVCKDYHQATCKPAAQRPKDACGYIGVSIAQLWVLHRTDPDFPRSLKPSPNVTLFRTSELDAYLERVQARTNGKAA